jgi:hypothetical protein
MLNVDLKYPRYVWGDYQASDWLDINEIDEATVDDSQLQPSAFVVRVEPSEGIEQQPEIKNCWLHYSKTK